MAESLPASGEINSKSSNSADLNLRYRFLCGRVRYRSPSFVLGMNGRQKRPRRSTCESSMYPR